MNAAASVIHPVGSWREAGGTRFRVWAPRARQVELHLVDEGRTVAMPEVGGGYREAFLSDCPAGTRYFYRLNGAVDRPDPASRYQPLGVHGPSEVTDRDFRWTDAAWRGVPWERFVIYEAHVGTFTPAGTFEAMIEHLDALADLGVTALQIMPVSQFPGGRNWGYDGVHPWAPQNTYGGPAGLKRLVDACHARGLAVVPDVVYNHLGPEGNYIGEFGPYYTDRHHTPWGAALNYDGPDSRAVRDFFLGNALYWLDEFHVDALRLDATHAIRDDSPTHFLAELAERIHDFGRQTDRHVFAIAESNANDPRVVRPAGGGGFGIDAQLVDDFHRSLHARLTGERRSYYCDFGSLDDFAKAYSQGYVLTGRYSRYRHQHWGREPENIPPGQFVAFGQCHDTVGNRPGGERLGRLVDFESLKLAAAALILSPCTPMLFMGEEYDDPAPFYYFTSHFDRRLGKAVRAGRLREFAAFRWPEPPPHPQSKNSFDRSKLNRELAAQGHHGVLRSFYRELLRLRRELPAIRSARVVTVDNAAGVVIAEGRHEGSHVWLCFHFGDKPVPLEDLYVDLAGGSILLDSSATVWNGATTAIEMGSIAPKSCLVSEQPVQRT